MSPLVWYRAALQRACEKAQELRTSEGYGLPLGFSQPRSHLYPRWGCEAHGAARCRPALSKCWASM